MKPLLSRNGAGLNCKAKLFHSLVAGGLLLLLPSARAQFTWPVYEPFGEYAEGTGLGSGSTTPWTQGNGTGTSNPHVQAAAALAYPALVADTNSTPKGVSSSTVTGSRDAGVLFAAHAGSIYCSFLISNMNNQGTTFDRMFFSLQTGSSTSSGFGMSVYLTTDYRLKIRKDPSGNPSGAFTVATPVLTTNATHLVVIRYQTNNVSTAPAEVDLWLDPTPFGSGASIPPPTLSTTNGANVNSFDMVNLASRGTGLYTYDIDEIRLGDTWTNVTPMATAAPGAMFAVTGGGSSCGDPVDVALNGSEVDNVYLLYANAIYTGISMNGTGTAVDFGGQLTPGYYSVLASNLNTTAVGWMSNSVTVSVVQPPVVVTEPLPVTTATNNRAAFASSVTGDTLVFQWYRSGSPLTDDAHLTGSTTNSLIIYPATTADIGDYYCIITNSCGVVAATTTNSLMLDAPNNLVWVGDGFNVDVWDVATSTEWSGGSGLFYPGDNVTFDDTYAYANSVTLAGILTPTAITVNASRNYLWGGTGNLTGSNALVKAGTGRLAVTNNSANSYANTYSGGTVISNGTVFVLGWGSLGSGPITLAGGTLESSLKGNATIGCSNTVLVTANSTYQTDQSGQQSAGFLGALIGAPGTTLLITNASGLTGSTNWVYVDAPSTNYSTIILTSSNAPTTAERLVCNNSTGVQNYNGPISEASPGQGELAQTGAGAVYLNAANTYTGPTTNTAGLLAGSGSINSPLTVSGTIGGGSATAIGTFTINNNLYLYGKVFIRVNKSLAQSNDLVSVTGILTNGGTGTVTITNLGITPLAAGDRFKIFSGAVSNGAALTVTGGGYVLWANNLAADGSIQVSSFIPSYATNISYAVGSGAMTIHWPATHLGWILQQQTNALAAGLATNWVDVANTAAVTSTNLTLSPTTPATFYRLRHP